MAWHWQKVKGRAKRTGRVDVPRLLLRVPENEISLVGHSLGARVTYYALQSLHDSGQTVQNAVFLGGAIRRNKSGWPRAGNAVRGQLVNVYHRDDRVLYWIYRMGEGRPARPCGIRPIELPTANLTNIDCTDVATRGPTNHWAYQHPAVLTQCLEAMSQRNARLRV